MSSEFSLWLTTWIGDQGLNRDGSSVTECSRDHGLIHMTMQWKIRVHKLKAANSVNRKAPESPEVQKEHDQKIGEELGKTQVTRTDLNAVKEGVKILPAQEKAQRPQRREISKENRDVIALGEGSAREHTVRNCGR